MLISGRLKQLRLAKNFSQGEMEKRTGLLRCYTSRVENGHTIPTVDTLEKYARALEIPMYRLYDKKPPRDVLPASKQDVGTGKAEDLAPLARALKRLNDRDQRLLLAFANRLAKRHDGRSRAKKVNAR
jgi:transcriptional regulator with XRE-family HTH domain